MVGFGGEAALDRDFVLRTKKEAQKKTGAGAGGAVMVFLLVVLLVSLEVVRPLVVAEFGDMAARASLFGACLVTALVFLKLSSNPREADLERLLHRAKIERSITSFKTPVESTHWIAALLDAFWEDLIEEKAASNVYKVLQDKINEKKPAFVSSLQVEAMGFGSTPPHLNNFVVQGTNDPELKVLEFDLDFNGRDFRLVIKAQGSDEYLLLKNRHFSFKITALGIRFRVRIYVHKKANMVFVCLVNKPDFYLFDPHMMGISPKAIPFFDIKEFLESRLEEVLVEPKRIPLALEEKILGPLPEPQKGLFEVKVLSCKDLPVTLVGGANKNRAIRPQVVVSTDLNTYKSKVMEGTSPQVNESFAVEVDSGEGAVDLLVVDANNHNKRLGTASFNYKLARAQWSTFYSESEDGLPMATKLNAEEKAPWKVRLPLKVMSEAAGGNRGRSFRAASRLSATLNVEISPITWTFEESDVDMMTPIRKEPSTIILSVIKAKFLEGKDRGGTSDPYAVVKYGKHFSKKTSVIAKTTCPIWAETFVMERSHGRHGDCVDIQVFDKDKMKNESLGTCKVSLKDLKYGQTKREWKFLKNTESGQIYYSVTHKKGMASSLNLEDMFAQVGGDTLVISVKEAKNLVAVDKQGDSDPYVVLEYDKAKKKSEVVMDDLNPQFNFNALFPYQPGKEGGKVALTVKDWNRVGKSNKSIGAVSLDVKGLEPGDSNEMWYKLEGVPTGQVLVAVFRTKPLEEEEAENEMLLCSPEAEERMISAAMAKAPRKKSGIFSYKIKRRSIFSSD